MSSRLFRRPLAAMVAAFLLSILGVGLIVLFTGMPETGTYSAGVEDEMSHLLLAETFAQGRLTNPPHPMWHHFETQYVLPQPTYTSKYPPALPLLMALGIVAGGHPFLGIWLGLGLMSAAVAWMLYAWLPPRWALLAALLFTLHLGISSDWTYYHSGGSIPSIIGAALLLGALRRTLRRPTVACGVLIGLGLLILSFGRPYEGMVLALAVAAVLAWWLFRDGRQPLMVKCRRVVVPVVCVLILTAGLHFTYNTAVTGHPLKLPYQQYVDHYREVPNIMLSRPGPPPETEHVVMKAKWQAEYEMYLSQRSFRGLLRATQWKLTEYWWFYVGPLLSLPLVLLLPCGWRRRWNLFALIAIAAVVGAVCLNFAMQVHYPAPAAPLIFFLIAVGLRTLSLRLPSQRVANGIIALVIAVQVVLTTKHAVDAAQARVSPPLWVRQRLAVRDFLMKIPGRHLVCISVDPDFKPHMDIVFNEPIIDEARIVWARSFTPESNLELMVYFKDRRIWTLHLPSEPTGIVLPTEWHSVNE